MEPEILVSLLQTLFLFMQIYSCIQISSISSLSNPVTSRIMSKLQTGVKM